MVRSRDVGEGEGKGKGEGGGGRKGGGDSIISSSIRMFNKINWF